MGKGLNRTKYEHLKLNKFRNKRKIYVKFSDLVCADGQKTVKQYAPRYFDVGCIKILDRHGMIESMHRCQFNSLPNGTILALTKFKTFADDKILVTQTLEFVLGGVENIVGKGENAGYQHFLLFPQCFLKLSLPEVLKVGIVW